jgi:hypothetical protein
MLGEAGAQVEHGLGVDLADPGLGDAEHSADLLQGQVLVVVEREDDLLALGQAVDGLASSWRVSVTSKAPIGPWVECRRSCRRG